MPCIDDDERWAVRSYVWKRMGEKDLWTEKSVQTSTVLKQRDS